MQDLNKLKSMEGIRGVASFIVLLSHLQLTFFLGIGEQFEKFLSEYLPHFFSSALGYMFRAIFDGDFSVWLFWVMSGFVLSIGYFRRSCYGSSSELDEVRSYLLASSIKRYFRLVVPVFISVLFAYFLLKNDLMTNKLLAEKLGSEYSVWLGSFYVFEASIFDAVKSAIWNTFFNYSKLESYNRVLWTMEAEFYGSLFIFAFLSLVGYSKIRYFIYPAIVLIFYTLQLHWLNSFVFGIILCDLYMNTASYKALGVLTKNKFISILLMFFFLLLIGMPNYAGVVHLILAVLLVFFVISSNIMSSFFSSKVPVFLGKISFSLYLVHLPIICSVTGASYLFVEERSNHNLAVVISLILTIALSLVLAMILNKIGDEKGIRLGRIISSVIIRLGRKNLS